MRLFLLLTLAHLTLHAISDEMEDNAFFATFGYLDFGGGDGAQDDMSNTLVNIPDDVKLDAVKDFQRYYGLEQTGVVDEPTRMAMETKRCGIPDKDSPDEMAGVSDVIEEDDGDSEGKKKRRKKKKKNKKNKSKSRGKRYVTTTTKWRKRILTYKFANYTSDIPEFLTRTAFKKAFDMWEDVSSLTFNEETNSNIDADIEIAYMTGKHKDGSAFNALVLGHAFFPRVGWLHMNDLQTWNYNSVRGTDTVFVAVHELGHILGLRHSKKGTIMHASYPGYQSDIKLSEDDIKGVQSLYGANPCYPNNPCQNGGACRKDPDGGPSAVCSCTSGWKGNKCQTKIEGETMRKCRAITISNGYVVPAGRLSPNQKARIYCDSGHEIVGASQFTCTFRGFYTPSIVHTQCRRKLLCPALSITDGEVYPRRAVEVETVVSFSCDDEYQISGPLRVKCTADGSYDRTPPKCVKIEVEEEEEEEDDTGCPNSFDAMSPRTTGDSLIYGFKGSRYWIYTRGETGAPKSFWKSHGKISNGFPNIPTHLDATFTYTDPESRERFICFVKWPQVYYWSITAQEIRRVSDFPTTFQLPGSPHQQITGAYRWDSDTIYFFVPYGYYIYKISEKQVNPFNFQPMTTFIGMPPKVTVTAAAKSFYNGIFYMFSGNDVYQVRLSDKQVLRNSPYEVSQLWRYGLQGCN